MSRLKQLYQATILEHNKNPRHFGVLDTYSHQAHGKNPLCGDEYVLYVLVDEDKKIDQISFVGKGCAISKAAASMMAERILGASCTEALGLKDAFLSLLSESCSSDDKATLGSLKVFEGVCEFPVRVKCAALIWRALEKALASDLGSEAVVSTE
ncbi:MAG: SUF system NifU family Fe-S cluster assembly protein [bacterium]